MSGWLVESELPYPQHVSFVCFCGKGTGCGELRIKLKFEKYVDRTVLWIKKHDEPALQGRGRGEYLLVNGIGEHEERMIEKVN